MTALQKPKPEISEHRKKLFAAMAAAMVRAGVSADALRAHIGHSSAEISDKDLAYWAEKVRGLAELFEDIKKVESLKGYADRNNIKSYLDLDVKEMMAHSMRINEQIQEAKKREVMEIFRS